MKKDGPKVVFGDKNEEVVIGVGTFERRAFKLNEVVYVKGLKSNHISISQLCDAGYKVLFDCHEGKVFDSKNKIVLISFRDNNIYMVLFCLFIRCYLALLYASLLLK